MTKSVLLVLTDNFDDMMFLTSQVILVEHGVDVLVCSIENGTAKGENSSVMTVALSEAIKQQIDYDGIIMIHGSDFTNWDFLYGVLDKFNANRKLIGFTYSSIDLIRKYHSNLYKSNKGVNTHNNLVYLSDLELSEDFVNKFAEMLST